MSTEISVPIPTSQFLEFASYLKSQGDARDPVDAISDAIAYYVENMSWKPELVKESVALGYQWKTLFLPAGTELRMQYRGLTYYARVVGDQLLFNEAATTPANFANTIAGGTRNAWKDLWVRRPNDNDWRVASDRRAEASGNDDSAKVE
jgi:hypothetical protein